MTSICDVPFFLIRTRLEESLYGDQEDQLFYTGE
jgi:hypothetical protein